MIDLQDTIILAREITFAADCQLRDRYGYPASSYTVQKLLFLIAQNPDNQKASQEIGIQNMTDDSFQLAFKDAPIDEEYELDIIKALRPLVSRIQELQLQRAERLHGTLDEAARLGFFEI